MSDNIVNDRILHEIQRELADMRDDRAVIVAMIDQLDAGLSSCNAELRSLRNRFDRFRYEVREAQTQFAEQLNRIELLLSRS